VPEAIKTNAIKIDQAFNSILPELDRYSSLVQKSGWTFGNNAERDAVQQSRTNLLLQMIKELFQLGALQAPDMAIMERLLIETDPGFWNNNPITAQNPSERVAAAMSQLREKLRKIRNNAVAPIGMPASQPGAQGGGEGYRVMGVR
jgi:hypothetical protein